MPRSRFLNPIPALLLLVLFLPPTAPALGQGPSASGGATAADAGRELVVGTKEAAPFAMRAPDGSWHGISIDLWRHVAERLHLRYRFADFPTVPALLEAAQAGQVDAAVAALTVTPERRQALDFTQPFYNTGLGVAVPGGLAGWLPVLRTFASPSFLFGVLTLLGIAVTVGMLIWLFERKHNPPYGGHPVRGAVAGLWWSAVAMTQAGAAQDGPKTLPGRVLAVVWMVASVVTIAVFIAGITSALTTQRMQGLVRNVQDLRALRVGAVQGSSTAGFLRAHRVRQRDFPDAAAALRAMQAGQLDAVVYDRPLLAWSIRQDFPSAQLLPTSFDSQSYAIALPRDGTLRPVLDVALLQALRSEWWQQTVFRYLGQGSDQGGTQDGDTGESGAR